MKLIHYSKTPLITVNSRKQTILKDEPTFRPKPTGLWVSDEDDFGWSSWCETEMPEWIEGTHPHEIQLASDAEILRLTSEKHIRDFDQEFRSTSYEINWNLVAYRWQGIIITPYQYSLRLSDVSWYYTWDCASGCIWDANAIASVTGIPHIIEEMPV